MTLGEWMKTTREEKGLDANDCAYKSGMLPSVWSRWENDHSRRKDGSPTLPSKQSVEMIARGLNVPIDEVWRAAGVVQDVSTGELKLARRLELILQSVRDAEKRNKIEELLEKDAAQYVSLLTA